MRLWADRAKASPATAGVAIRAYDVLVDRNNNMVEDLPPAGTDAIISYPAVPSDVEIHMDPGLSGTVSQRPFNTFPISPNPLVFRQDGQIYSYSAGSFTEVSKCAYVVQSRILPDANNATAQKATYKFRFVELERRGGVRLVGLRR